MRNHICLPFALTLLFCLNVQADDGQPWLELFNGKDLGGWEANVRPESFSVSDGILKVHGRNGMAHLFYVGDGEKDVQFKNFELTAIVRSEPNSNSGIFFHTDRELRKGRYLNKGYEVQLNSSEQEKRKTGSLYAVVNLDISPVDETKWFEVRIRVEGKRIQVHIDGKRVVDYIEPENPQREPSRAKRLIATTGGAIAIQAHDPGSVFYFKQIRIRELREESSAARFPKHRFVTSNPNAQDMWPCFSPDSQTLLFTRTIDRKSWSLFTVSVNGGESKPFPTQAPASGTRANWSARHNLIAFNGQPPKGQFNLSVINGDGSGLRVLQAPGISDHMSYPSWYPDGKSVAVVDFDRDQGSTITRIDIEQGTVETLTDPKTHWAGVPRVSPDGNLIVMGGQVRQGQRYSQYQNRIWFLNRDGELRPLDSKRGWAPFWSPDGKWIVFASDRGSDDGRWAIFIASPDGTTVRQLTPLELNAGHPTWSPDGKLIAFFAQHSADTKARGLAVMQADAVLALARSKSKQSDLDQFFRQPPEFANDLGDYPSPLKFYGGGAIKTAEDWQARREEILDRWHKIMGAWPPLIEEPSIEYVKTERRENFTQHHVRVEMAPGLTHPAILLVPDGEGPFPAAVVPFYWAETGAGLPREPNQPQPTGAVFGYELTKRGFVTLSLGFPSSLYYPSKEQLQLQPLSALAYAAANCHTALANLPEVDSDRIGIVGHSYGGKWAMFASCLYDKFACAAWSDGGIVFDEKRANVNYWEPWYLGYELGKKQRQAGIPNKEHSRTGAYKQLVEEGLDLHELHALMAPRPFLVSGGSEDRAERWKALNHSIAVNELLGYENRVAMTNRRGHSPTAESNEQIYLFFERFLKKKE